MDKTSWTEPLDSGCGRWYLGIESRRGCDGRRVAGYMSVAGRLPVLERRCEHYGRGLKMGQRSHLAQARLPRRDERFVIWSGNTDEALCAHGGGRGCGVIVAMR